MSGHRTWDIPRRLDRLENKTEHLQKITWITFALVLSQHPAIGMVLQKVIAQTAPSVLALQAVLVGH